VADDLEGEARAFDELAHGLDHGGRMRLLALGAALLAAGLGDADADEGVWSKWTHE
jgi:hypothetical protein